MARWMILLMMLTPMCGRAGPSDLETTPDVSVFSQRVAVVDPDGSTRPCTMIRPATMPRLDRLEFSLGRGRTLDIRTNLPVDRRDALDEVAALVRRCYRHVETATGRTVNGGFLLYMIAFEEPPISYDFEAKTPEHGLWSQVRIAVLDLGDPRCGGPDDPRLQELLLDTLPHELGHELMAALPTIRLDLSDGSGRGTRWFEEGVCEVLAKTFSAAENPEAHRTLLAQRRIADVLDRPGVRSRFLDWSQVEPLSPELESALYGASMLMVMEWTRKVPLASLLERMSAADAPRDGWDLLSGIQADMETDLLGVLNGAADLGRDLALSPPPS